MFGGRAKSNIMIDKKHDYVLLAKFRINAEVGYSLSPKGMLVSEFIIQRVVIFAFSDNLFSNHYINNKSLFSIILKSIFNVVIEMHSRNQRYLVLKNLSSNLTILCNYASLIVQFEKYRLAYEAYVQYLNDYDDFLLKEKLHKDSMEESERIVDEIDFFFPAIGEEEILKIRPGELNWYEFLCNALLRLRDILILNAGAYILSDIKELICNAEYLLRINNSYFELVSCLKSSYYEPKDIIQAYSKYLCGVICADKKIEFVENRLYDLYGLKKRDGSRIGDVITLRKTYHDIVDLSFNFETEKMGIRQKLNGLFESVKKLVSDISGIRQFTALGF